MTSPRFIPSFAYPTGKTALQRLLPDQPIAEVTACFRCMNCRRIVSLSGKKRPIFGILSFRKWKAPFRRPKKLLKKAWQSIKLSCIINDRNIPLSKSPKVSSGLVMHTVLRLTAPCAEALFPFGHILAQKIALVNRLRKFQRFWIKQNCFFVPFDERSVPRGTPARYTFWKKPLDKSF